MQMNVKAIAVRTRRYLDEILASVIMPEPTESDEMQMASAVIALESGGHVGP
jgi:hypothetical protein